MTDQQLFSVSVIIPVFNGARFLERCLDSVLAQTLLPQQIIVVNDASTDGTAEILHAYSQRTPLIHVITNSRNRKLPTTRNIGIAASTAPWVAFLDADDVWLPTKLERQIEFLKTADSKVGVVYCGYKVIDDKDDPMPHALITPPSVRGDVFMNLLQGGNLISGSASAVLVRRSALDAAGHFNESLTFAEDWDLWLRLARVCTFDFVPEDLVLIRRHPHSMQQQNDLENRGRQLFQILQVLDKYRVPFGLICKDHEHVVGLLLKKRFYNPWYCWKLYQRLMAGGDYSQALARRFTKMRLVRTISRGIREKLGLRKPI